MLTSSLKDDDDKWVLVKFILILIMIMLFMYFLKAKCEVESHEHQEADVHRETYEQGKISL
jgi:uncharacterized membrane protein